MILNIPEEHLKRPPRESIAIQIREAREKLGWTQTELGKKMSGLHQQQIGRLEDPGLGNSLNNIERAAQVLGIQLFICFNYNLEGLKEVEPFNDQGLDI